MTVPPRLPLRFIVPLLLLVSGFFAPRTVSAQGRYYTRNFTFEDVDVATFVDRLEWIGVEVPIELTGRVTADLTIGVPLGNLGSAQAYRIDGTFDASNLTVSDVALEQVHAVLRYRDGTLTLSELKFAIPDTEGNGSPGRFAGESRLGLVPRGSLTGELKLTDVPLQSLAEAFPELPRVGSGRASGDLEFSADAANLGTLGSWTAVGSLQFRKLSVADRVIDSGSAKLSLKENRLTVVEIDAKATTLKLTGQVRAELDGKQPLSGELKLTTESLSGVQPLLGEAITLPEPVSGAVTITASLGGTLSPPQPTATGRISGQQLTIGGVTVPKLSTDYKATTDRLAFESLQIDIAGGRITGKAAIPFGGEVDDENGKPLTTQLKIEQLAMQQLAGKLPLLPESLTGTLSGTVDATIPSDRVTDPKAWTVSADLTIPSDKEKPVLNAKVNLTDGVLKFPTLTFRTGDTSLDASGSITLKESYPLDVQIDGRNLKPGLLETLPEGVRPSFTFGGAFDVQAKAKGTLDPLKLDGDGTLNAEELALAGITVRNTKVQFTVNESRLNLDPVKLELGGGSISGRATLPLDDATAGDAELTWKNISLDKLSEAGVASVLPESLSGRTSGEATVTIPQGERMAPTNWTAKLSASLTEGQLWAWPLDRVQIAGSLVDRKLTLQQIEGDLEETRLRGSGSFGFDDRQPLSAKITLTNEKLSRWNSLPSGFGLPVELAGRADAQIDLSGTLADRKFEGTGELNGRDVRVAEVSVPELDLTAEIAPQRWTIDLDAQVADGRVTADAVIPIANGDGSLDATIRDLNVQPFLSLLPELPAWPCLNLNDGSLAGRVSASLDASFNQDTLTDPLRWSGPVSLSVREGVVAGRQPVRIELAGKLERQTLTLSRLNAQIAEATLRSSGSIGLTEPFAFTFDGNAEQVRLESWLGGPSCPENDWDVTGILNVNADVRGQISPFELTGTGRISSSDIVAREVPLSDVAIDFDATPERIETELSLQLFEGSVTGSMTLPLAKDADGSFDLRLKGIALEPAIANVAKQMSAALPPTIGPISGTLNTKIQGRLPSREQLTDPGRWRGTATAELQRLRVGGWSNLAVSTELGLNNGVLVVEALSIDGPETKLNGQGAVSVVSPFAYRGSLSIKRFNLSELKRLPETLRPTFPLGGVTRGVAWFSGEVASGEVDAWGAAEATDLVVNQVRLEEVHTLFRATPDAVQFRSAWARGFGGEAVGEGSWSWAGETPLQLSIVGDSVNVRPVVELFDSDQAEKTAGSLTGRVELTFGRGDDDGWQLRGAATDLAARKVRYSRSPEVSGRVVSSLADGLLKYDLKLNTLGADVVAKGAYAPLPTSTNRERVNRGTLTVRGFKAEALRSVWPQNGALRNLRGVARAEASWKTGGESWVPEATGTLELSNVSYELATITDRLRLRFRTEDGTLRIQETSGALLGGRLSLQGRYPIRGKGTGPFQLQLRGMELATLTGLATGQRSASKYSGRVDVRLDGRFGPTWTGSGQVELVGVNVQRVRLGAIRLPIQLSFDPGTVTGRLRMTDASGSFLGGRLRGSATLARTPTAWGVDTDVRFQGVSLSFLAGANGVGLNRGQATGRLILKGSNVTSIDGLRGSLNADLKQIGVLDIPILDLVQPYLGPIPGGNPSGEGTVRVTLKRGVVRLQRLSLAGNSVQLFATGTITTRKRLNLEVMLATKTLGNQPLIAQTLLNQIPAFGPPPIALALRINQFLSNRVIYLSVGGTLSQPRVRPLTGKTLQAEATRFFLQLATGNAAPALPQ